MKVGIDMGATNAGSAATLDLEELLATRLLVQGNSGSGKSHLLRRLIEQSAQWVQQAVIDPEGDFVTLAERFGHVVVEADEHSEAALQSVAARVRQHRVSVVLNLEGLDAEMQMRHAAAFLGGLFDADRDFWYPMLVVVDEAHPRCNLATDIAAFVGQNAFGALKAGIQMVTAPHTPVPFAPSLEDLYVPSADSIASAVRRTLSPKGARSIAA